MPTTFAPQALKSIHRTATTLLPALLVAGLLAGGCQPSPGKAAGGDLSGVYSLTRVDGLPVPATVTHGKVPLRVNSGTLTLNADGTCVCLTRFVPPSGVEVNREVKATYTREGNRLDLSWQGAGRTVATVEGDTVLHQNEGMVFAYQR